MQTIRTLLPVLTLALAACAQPPSSSRPIGMANPASVYCVRQGGKLLPQKDAAGNAYALCQLPDGREVEEWALFRSRPSEQ